MIIITTTTMSTVIKSRTTIFSEHFFGCLLQTTVDYFEYFLKSVEDY